MKQFHKPDTEPSRHSFYSFPIFEFTCTTRRSTLTQSSGVLMRIVFIFKEDANSINIHVRGHNFHCFMIIFIVSVVAAIQSLVVKMK